MNTTKKGVRTLAEACLNNGIRKVVFSPGSRSAPLYIAFSQISKIECVVIPDERVAGYFALGMAQQTGEAVAVACTSGTAVLNLYPAVCEAYYQQVPLLILTADRPIGFANKGENQSINQDGIFGMNSGPHYSINGDADANKELKKINEIVTEALLAAARQSVPVHVNVHLDEPLYELTDEPQPAIKSAVVKEKAVKLSSGDSKKIKATFSKYGKKMILVGMHVKDPVFSKKLEALNKRKDVVVLYETTSNIALKDAVWNIDATLSVIKKEREQDLLPDLVISLGGAIVSKKVKQFLKDKPKLHWDIPVKANVGGNRAMFGNKLEKWKDIKEDEFLDALIGASENKESSFKRDWLDCSKKANFLSAEYFEKAPFSDLKVFETIIRTLPVSANIQYGNSTPVRYSNLFPHTSFGVTVNSNRGTSGIDGCLSTAAGAAYINEKQTIAIVGDISFFYDSNALWNNYLAAGYRIIVINNSGGNIFRLIDGPPKIEGFEKFFETKHQLTARNIASMHSIPYYFCDKQSDLEKKLKDFYKPQKTGPAILEIKTDGIKSAAVYRDYFKYLSTNKPV